MSVAKMSTEALSQIDGKRCSSDAAINSNNSSDSKNVKSDEKNKSKVSQLTAAQSKRVNIYIRVRGDNINDIDQCNFADYDVEAMTWRPNLLDGGKWTLDGPSSESATLTQFPMCRELLRQTRIIDFQFAGHNVIVYTFGPHSSGKTYSLLGAKTAEVMRQKSSCGLYKVAHVQTKDGPGSSYDSLHRHDRNSITSINKLENSVLNTSMQTISCMSTDLATIAESASYSMSEYRIDNSNEFNMSRLYMESINCVGMDQLAQHYGQHAHTPSSAKKSNSHTNRINNNATTTANNNTNNKNKIINESSLNTPKSLKLDPESGLLWHYFIELFAKINRERRSSQVANSNSATPLKLEATEEKNYQQQLQQQQQQQQQQQKQNATVSSNSITTVNNNVSKIGKKYVYISALEFFNHEWYDLLGRELNNVDTVEHARFVRASTLEEAFQVVRSVRARRLELFVPALTSSVSHFVIQIRLQTMDEGPVHMYSSCKSSNYSAILSTEAMRHVIGTAYFIDMASCFYNEKDRPELSKVDVTNYLRTLDTFQECMQNTAMGKVEPLCASPSQIERSATEKRNSVDRDNTTVKHTNDRRHHERWENFLQTITNQEKTLPRILGLYTIPSSESLSLNSDLSLRCAMEVRSCAARQSRLSIHKAQEDEMAALSNGSLNTSVNSNSAHENVSVPRNNAKNTEPVKTQEPNGPMTTLTPSPPSQPLLPGAPLPIPRNNSTNVPFTRPQLNDGVAPRPPSKPNPLNATASNFPAPVPLPGFPRGSQPFNTNNNNNNSSGSNKVISQNTDKNGRPATSESVHLNKDSLNNSKTEAGKVRNKDLSASVMNTKSHSEERKTGKDILPPLPITSNYSNHLNTPKDTPFASGTKETFLQLPSSIGFNVANSVLVETVENYRSTLARSNRLTKSVSEQTNARSEIANTDIFISAQNTNSANVPNKGVFGYSYNELMGSAEYDDVIGDGNNDDESIVSHLPPTDPTLCRLVNLEEDEQEFRRSIKDEEANRRQEVVNVTYAISRQLIQKISERETWPDEPQLRKKFKVQATELDKLRMSTLNMNIKEFHAVIAGNVAKEPSFLSKLTMKKKTK